MALKTIWFSYDERPDMKPGPRSVVVVDRFD